MLKIFMGIIVITLLESCFKGLARSLRTALEMDPRNKKSIPSTKGSL